MIARIWQKLGLIILIIAWLFNIVSKIVNKMSFDDELAASAGYIQSIEEDNKNK